MIFCFSDAVQQNAACTFSWGICFRPQFSSSFPSHSLFWQSVFLVSSWFVLLQTPDRNGFIFSSYFCCFCMRWINVVGFSCCQCCCCCYCWCWWWCCRSCVFCFLYNSYIHITRYFSVAIFDFAHIDTQITVSLSLSLLFSFTFLVGSQIDMYTTTFSFTHFSASYYDLCMPFWFIVFLFAHRCVAFASQFHSSWLLFFCCLNIHLMTHQLIYVFIWFFFNVVWCFFSSSAFVLLIIFCLSLSLTLFISILYVDDTFSSLFLFFLTFIYSFLYVSPFNTFQ